MKKLTLPLALLATLSFGTANAGIIIDDFEGDRYSDYGSDTAPTINSLTTPTAFASNTWYPTTNPSNPCIAGGYCAGYASYDYGNITRQLYGQATNASSIDLLTVSLNPTNGAGLFRYGTSSGVNGSATLVFQLGGNYDLTTLGGTSNAFQIAMNSSDLAGGTWGIGINGTAPVLLGTTAALTPPGTTYNILYSAFGANWDATPNSIEFYINGTPELDISFQQFGTTCVGCDQPAPAPNSLSLMGIGVTAFALSGFVSIRRKSNQAV